MVKSYGLSSIAYLFDLYVLSAWGGLVWVWAWLWGVVPVCAWMCVCVLSAKDGVGVW